jgi:hypothetical protein
MGDNLVPNGLSRGLQEKTLEAEIARWPIAAVFLSQIEKPTSGIKRE